MSTLRIETKDQLMLQFLLLESYYTHLKIIRYKKTLIQLIPFVFKCKFSFHFRNFNR